MCPKIRAILPAASLKLSGTGTHLSQLTKMIFHPNGPNDSYIDAASLSRGQLSPKRRCSPATHTIRQYQLGGLVLCPSPPEPGCHAEPEIKHGALALASPLGPGCS